MEGNSIIKSEKLYSVYRHTSPSGKVYIGITCQPVTHRWNNGKGYMNLAKAPFKSTIIKYGWDNIKHEVLFSGLPEKRAKRLEISLIRHYKNLGISLNVSDGGEGPTGAMPWNKGKKMPYDKIRRGFTLTEEHKQKLREAHLGKPVKGHKWTEAQRAKMMPVLQNRAHTEDAKRKISEHSAKSRPVVELDVYGNIIERFKSIRNAAQKYGINEKLVGSCCAHRFLCYGHIFLFEDDSMDISDVRYSRYKDGNTISIQNIETGEIKHFNSQSSCARFLGHKHSHTVRKALKYGRLLKGVWKIIEADGHQENLLPAVSRRRRLKIKNVETGEERVMPSIVETASFLELNTTTPIQKALRHKRSTNVINGWEVQYAA